MLHTTLYIVVHYKLTVTYINCCNINAGGCKNNVSFQIGDWSQKIRKEMRMIDRQIRGKIQSASDKNKLDIFKMSVQLLLCSFTVGL